MFCETSLVFTRNPSRCKALIQRGVFIPFGCPAVGAQARERDFMPLYPMPGWQHNRIQKALGTKGQGRDFPAPVALKRMVVFGYHLFVEGFPRR